MAACSGHTKSGLAFKPRIPEPDNTGVISSLSLLKIQFDAIDDLHGTVVGF
jgi:hypothetical protein